MFTQTWKKYLPVIAILMKRSFKGEQTLQMNYTDFERASGGRKVKFGFSKLILNNGRIIAGSQHLPLARELAILLQEDELTRKLLPKKEFEFSMRGALELYIKDNTSPDISPSPGAGTDKAEQNEQTDDSVDAIIVPENPS